MSRDRAFKLKFEISFEDFDRLQAEFCSAPAEVEKSRHLSVYLDTPDALLHGQDVIWCFSRKDKLRDSGDKLGEWRLDGESDARSFVKKNRLKHWIGGAFTSRTTHESVMVQIEEAEIEITLDRISLRAGAQREDFAEVHFALRDNDPSILESFVARVVPHGIPETEAMTLVERGYQIADTDDAARVAEVTESAPAAPKSVTKSGGLSVGEAFKSIARQQAQRALGETPPTDAASVRANLEAARRLQCAFRFFASLSDPDSAQPDLRPLDEWEALLEKAYELDRVLNDFLKPAAARGRWEAASSLIARIDEIRARAYVVLAQSWSQPRVKNTLTSLAEWVETCALTDGAAEPLSAFLAREFAKALGEVVTTGESLRNFGIGAARADDMLPLTEAVARLHDVAQFFEPLAHGKAARRCVRLSEALGDLRALLEGRYRLGYAQTLLTELASHIARMKQTKTQIAQTFAAGALAGYIEAKKTEVSEKALKSAIEEVSEVKPFWTKLD